MFRWVPSGHPQPSTGASSSPHRGSDPERNRHVRLQARVSYRKPWFFSHFTAAAEQTRESTAQKCPRRQESSKKSSTRAESELTAISGLPPVADENPQTSAGVGIVSQGDADTLLQAAAAAAAVARPLDASLEKGGVMAAVSPVYRSSGLKEWTPPRLTL